MTTTPLNVTSWILYYKWLYIYSDCGVMTDDTLLYRTIEKSRSGSIHNVYNKTKRIEI